MNRCKALVIGGSAGSLDPLIESLPHLKTNLHFPIIIVVHRKPGNESLLIELLQNKTTLKVKEATEKMKIEPSTIYVAPADYHLLIEQDKTFSLDYSEKINFSRPSIDVTFKAAAEVYQHSLTCILLSGSNSDGTIGLQYTKKLGGITAVQNPETAIIPFMPEYALINLIPNAILNAEDIATFINKLD